MARKPSIAARIKATGWNFTISVQGESYVCQASRGRGVHAIIVAAKSPPLALARCVEQVELRQAVHVKPLRTTKRKRS